MTAILKALNFLSYAQCTLFLTAFSLKLPQRHMSQRSCTVMKGVCYYTIDLDDTVKASEMKMFIRKTQLLMPTFLLQLSISKAVVKFSICILQTLFECYSKRFGVRKTSFFQTLRSQIAFIPKEVLKAQNVNQVFTQIHSICTP